MSAGHSDNHDHGHDHHGHGHGADFSSAFLIGIILNVGFVVVETVFGFIAGSMALVADAGHNLTDVLGLFVAWGGATLARRLPSPRFTYGLKKASILAALINAIFLLVAVGAIAAEAVRRLFHPTTTEGTTVMIVAAVGIVINGLTALLFARGRKGDINVRGAFLHMMADTVVSAAVLFAGAVIFWTGQQWVDPVMGLAVAVVILWGSIGLLKESTWMTLAGVPSGIFVEDVEAALSTLPGVEAVHDLHVWPLSTTETALTAHLVVPKVETTDRLLQEARAMVHDRFGIAHCTLQLERAFEQDCDDC